MPKDSNYADTYWSLGLAYEQKRMYREAIAAFQRAVELSKSPEFDEGKPEMLGGACGHAYALARKAERSQEHPGSVEEEFNLATLCFALCGLINIYSAE